MPPSDPRPSDGRPQYQHPCSRCDGYDALGSSWHREGCPNGPRTETAFSGAFEHGSRARVVRGKNENFVGVVVYGSDETRTILESANGQRAIAATTDCEPYPVRPTATAEATSTDEDLAQANLEGRLEIIEAVCRHLRDTGRDDIARPLWEKFAPTAPNERQRRESPRYAAVMCSECTVRPAVVCDACLDECKVHADRMGKLADMAGKVAVAAAGSRESPLLERSKREAAEEELALVRRERDELREERGNQGCIGRERAPDGTTCPDGTDADEPADRGWVCQHEHDYDVLRQTLGGLIDNIQTHQRRECPGIMPADCLDAIYECAEIARRVLGPADCASLDQEKNDGRMGDGASGGVHDSGDAGRDRGLSGGPSLGVRAPSVVAAHSSSQGDAERARGFCEAHGDCHARSLTVQCDLTKMLAKVRGEVHLQRNAETLKACELARAEEREACAKAIEAERELWINEDKRFALEAAATTVRELRMAKARSQEKK